MSYSLPGAAAATAKDGYPYPRDNFRGESSDDESYSYPNSQKQQISQPQQGYAPKDDYPQPYSSKQPRPSVQVPPPKTDYLPPSTSYETANQMQWIPQSSFQEVPVRASLPQNLPKSNNYLPSSQTWDQSWQHVRKSSRKPVRNFRFVD
ncbi:hypothetical protein PTKIN_Ptkin16aG0482100 [Pterospermum kingtungense]